MQLLIRLAVLAALFTATAVAQCSFQVSSASQTVVAAGGNFSLTLTASASNCTRTVSSNTSWITISFGQSGTGTGTFGFTVLPNNTNQQRTGTINAAGVVVTITQQAGTCSYQLTPTSATISSAGGTGSFSVASGCSWQATTTASWITLSSAQGTGDGVVGYTADAYTGGADRTGTISVGGTNFTLRQSAACVFSTGTGNITAVATQANYNINVQGAETCQRTATTDVDWITIASGATGSGGGSITITVAANTTRLQRIGGVLINGTRFVVVIQAASTCIITLNPSQNSVPAAGARASFGVTANCAWTAVSDSNWLQVTSGASGSGSGSVAYLAGENLGAAPRSGVILVNSVEFRVNQAGAQCSVLLDESSAVFPATGGERTIRVNLQAGCPASVTVSDTSWIRLVRNGVDGSGPGDITFRVEPNPSNRERTGVITIGDKTYGIRQLPSRCTLAIDRTTQQVVASGGRGELGVTTNCTGWTAVPSVGWIQVTGTTPNLLTFSVSPNDGQNERTGTIVVSQADPPERYTLTLTQDGQRCTVTLSTTTASLPARGGDGVFNVTGGTGCNWSAVSSTDWLSVEWSSVSGAGNVRFSAGPNTTGADRLSSIAVSGQAVTVQQPALRIAVTEAGVVNAASFAGGGVAPGEVITIYGSGFGPTALTTLRLNPNGQTVANTLGDTRVFFDNDPSPMVYVVEGQLSAIVPYAVAGKQTVGVRVEYLGVRSNVVTLPVVTSAPAIFTLTQTGRGQAAVLNQNFTVNGAENPATRGSVLQIFATGEGQTRPNGVDGRLAVAPLPVPVLPVQVFIGGVQATVQYAGGAPGLTAGVMQVNAVIPQTVTPGTEVPIVVRVGTVNSPAGPTVAVR